MTTIPSIRKNGNINKSNGKIQWTGLPSTLPGIVTSLGAERFLSVFTKTILTIFFIPGVIYLHVYYTVYLTSVIFFGISIFYLLIYSYKFKGAFFRHDRRTAPKFGTHVRIETILALTKKLTYPTPGEGGY